MSNRTPHALACVIAVSAASLAIAGPLTPPPGAPSPTAKPLSDVEPRIAINSDNTPGNSDSVFRITQSGSYYLTDNISNVGFGRAGIVVDVDNVTIDLNGFTIAGTDSETELAIDGLGRSGLTVRNGFIETWGDQGIASSTTLTVQDVHFDDVDDTVINASSGLRVVGCSFRFSGPIVPPDGSLIIGCRFRDQADAIQSPDAEGVMVIDTVIDGQNTTDTGAVISLGAGAVLSRVVVAEEGQTAAFLGASSLVDRCVFTGQLSGGGTRTGLVVGTNSIVTNTVVQDYGGLGISAGSGVRIEGNSIFSCAGGGIQTVSSGVIANNTLESNGGIGIDATNGSLVINNTVRSSEDDGILVRGDCTVRGNSVDGDPIRVIGSDNVVDGNTITDATPNPIIIESGGNLAIRNMFSTGSISVTGTNTVAATVGGSAAVDAAGPFANIRH